MSSGIRGEPLRLTDFHAREMLYDYIMNRLDDERKAAVEERLTKNPNLRNELDVLKSGISFCEQLSKTQVDAQVIQNLKDMRLKSEILTEKARYKNWPELLKWSSEALVLSIFVAAIGWLVPWQEVSQFFKFTKSNEVVLAKIDKSKAESEGKNDNLAPVAREPETNGKVSTVMEIEKTETIKSETVPEKIEPVKIESTKVEPVKKQSGFLYRLLMSVDGIKEKAPNLTEKIIALEGKKAGDVAIGHRQPRGNYFHFSIPESNYNALLKTLREYGPVQIYKGPHPRIMPDGVIRVILTIEDAEKEDAKSIESQPIEKPAETESPAAE